MAPRRAGRGEAVRRAAMELLARVEQGAWSDRLLHRAGGAFDDPRDRALLTRLVYTTLRWQPAIDEAIPPGDRPVRERCAVRLAVAQAAALGLPVPVAVSSTVGGLALLDRRAAGRVNARLRRLLAGGVPELDPVRAVPGWLLERWTHTFGTTAARALAEATTRPARPFVVDLRAWGRRAAGAGGGLVPGGHEIARGGAGPKTGGPVLEPSVAVDPGAAIVARLAADGPEGPAADLAAAPGGKTLLLAWRRADATVALEPHPGRARALARRLAGAEVPSPVAVVRADGCAPPLVRGGFAVVLLDAPCSGTGTLRRRPERRVRITPDDIARAAALQRALLDGAARLVAPGGRLVYAVCSLEPEEGIEQVRSFLARHPEFDLDDAPARLGAEAAPLADPREPRCLLTRPDLGPWEGFQAACLVLRSGRANLRARHPAGPPGDPLRGSTNDPG